MENIWVSGSEGQLGSEIESSNHKCIGNFFFTKQEEVDITEKIQIENYIKLKNIDLIINCAAYTAVDKAEEEIEIAYKVNSLAIRNLVEICKKYKCKLIHISTDFVYGDTYLSPINELTKTSPKSVYAKSKLDGERYIINSKIDSVIIRTSWLYSKFGNNFVKTILQLSKNKETISVVNDQYGTPTYTKDLVEICLEFIKTNKENINGQEIYNYSNEGSCSWYEFACEIINLSKLISLIVPISSKEFCTLAKRPAYSVLDKDKIKKKLSIEIPFWKDSLSLCIKELIK